ncbi:MAG: hypothetical protein OHK0017_05650 [Patescibacteria group bacterium]
MSDISQIANLVLQTESETPIKFEYNPEFNLTVFEEIEALGSTKEKKVYILDGDQTKSLAARLSGEETHLEPAPGRPRLTREDLLIIKEEHGAERAYRLVQGAVDDLVRKTKLVFYTESVFDTEEPDYSEKNQRKAKYIDTLIFSPQYYTETFRRWEGEDPNTPQDVSEEKVLNARKLAANLIQKRVAEVELKLKELKEKSNLKLSIDKNHLSAELDKSMVSKGFKLSESSNKRFYLKSVQRENKEATREKNPLKNLLKGRWR